MSGTKLETEVEAKLAAEEYVEKAKKRRRGKRKQRSSKAG